MIDERDRIVTGAPGGLAFWAFEVVKALAAQHRPHALTVQLVDHLGVVPPSPPHEPGRILLCHYPTAQMLDAMTDEPPRIVYLAEPPHLVVNYLIVATGRRPLEAIRVCTASYVANIALLRANAAVLDRASLLSIPDVLTFLCERLALDVDPLQLAAYANHLEATSANAASVDAAISAFLPAARRIEAADPASQPETSTLISAILTPLHSLLQAGTDQPPAQVAITWPSAAFLLADRSAASGAAIDLTGPARMLYHGPYFHLPPATYTVDVTIAVNTHICDASFRVEVRAGEHRLAQARMQPKTSGRFVGQVSILHTLAAAEVQLQIISERGAIEGEFSLVQVTLKTGTT